MLTIMCITAHTPKKRLFSDNRPDGNGKRNDVPCYGMALYLRGKLSRNNRPDIFVIRTVVKYVPIHRRSKSLPKSANYCATPRTNEKYDRENRRRYVFKTERFSYNDRHGPVRRIIMFAMYVHYDFYKVRVFGHTRSDQENACPFYTVRSTIAMYTARVLRI